MSSTSLTFILISRLLEQKVVSETRTSTKNVLLYYVNIAFLIWIPHLTKFKWIFLSAELIVQKNIFIRRT